LSNYINFAIIKWFTPLKGDFMKKVTYMQKIDYTLECGGMTPHSKGANDAEDNSWLRI
jgi:hypothetical protein